MTTRPQSPVLLIIDNDETSISTIRQCAEQLVPQITTTVCRDTRSAIATTTAQYFPLILSELKADDIDGLRLLRALREQPKGSSAPMVVIYSNLIDESAPPLSDSRVQFLSKPLPIQTLADRIQAIYGKPGLAASKVLAQPTPSRPRLDSDTFALFNTGVANFFSKMLGTDIEQKRTVLRKTAPLVAAIGGAQPIKSRVFDGQMIMVSDEACFLNICNHLFKQNTTEINETNCDTFAEICNQAFGFAKVALNDQGFGIEIALPFALTKEQCDFGPVEHGQICVNTEFKCEFGSFAVEIQIHKLHPHR